jgi:hypothetical protein
MRTGVFGALFSLRVVCSRGLRCLVLIPWRVLWVEWLIWVVVLLLLLRV